MKRTQRVVLRNKVKKKRLRSAGIFLAGCLAVGAGVSGIFYVGTQTKKWLSGMNLFLVKWTEVSGPEDALTPLLMIEMQQLHGRFLLAPLESELKESILPQFPEIASLQLRRSFPDKLRLDVAKRQAVAQIEVKGTTLQLMDDFGAVYSPKILREVPPSLPRVYSESRQNMEELAHFLRRWQEEQKQNAAWKIFGPLARLDINRWNELTVQCDSLQVFWGNLDPELQQVKWKKFVTVVNDLEAKQVFPQRIDLTLVPESRLSPLGDREVTGRIFVEKVTPAAPQ